jgi:hypothetical protein
MGRSKAIRCIGVMVALLAAAPAWASSLLRNGSFQYAGDGSYNASPNARYWASWGNAARESWVSVGKDQYSATIRNWAGTNPDAGWYQDVPATPGARYIFSGQLSASWDLAWNQVKFKLEFMDAAYQVLDVVTQEVSGVGLGGWTTHEARGTAPARTAWLRCVWLVDGIGTVGSMSADDFRLIEGPIQRPGRSFNLLENGGFYLAADNSTAAGPASRFWARWGDATRENWFSFEGDGFLATIHNWGSTAADGGWYQDVRAEPGHRYRLSGFAQKEACYTADALLLKLEFLDVYQDPLLVVTQDLAGVNTWWTDVYLSGDAPEGTVWARCTVLAENQGTCGALKIDGLRLTELWTPIKELPNLLVNDSFTNGVAGWNFWGGATNVDWVSQDGDGFAGALQNLSGTQGDGGLYQEAPAEADDKFHFSGWFQAESWYGYSALYLIVEFRDTYGNLLGNSATQLNGLPDTWEYYEVEGKAPVGAVTARALIVANGQGSGGLLYFDHLRFVKPAVRELQRLEPIYGAYAAANPDMSFEDFNRILDWDHVGNGQFLSFPNDYHAALDGAAELSLRNGAIYLITISHWGYERVGDVTEQMAEDFAEWCRYWNDRGLPIFVRYGHEMNADWYYTWGLQPHQYRRSFRLIAEAVHRKAPLTAMVWAPYLAGGYPQNHNWKNVWDYIYDGNLRGTVADFTLLDTDHNGFINAGDDPYGPYYPGDEHVDWVGVSIYHWSTGYPFWFNTYPYARFVEHDLTGSTLGYGQYDFYFRYCEERGKPLMIPETGCMFKQSRPPNWYNYSQYSNDEAYNKSKWIEQLYNVLGDTGNAADVANHFPRLKAIYYFSIDKFEGEADGPPGYGGQVDWTLTTDSSVRYAYRYHITAMKNQRRYWLRAGDLKGYVYSWNTAAEDWAAMPGAPFQVSVTNESPFEGRACLRLDYDNSARSEDFTAAGNYNAMKDAIGWRDFNAIYLRVRIPPPEPINPVQVRLVMESSETAWDVLATNTVPADGAWHTVVFPYDWTRHNGSSWLNLHLRLDLPFGEPRTLYVDALEAALDTDLDGYPDDVDTDDDGDGVADVQELNKVMDPYNAQDAAEDADGDGYDNGEEAATDTDPHDAGSFLEIEQAAASSNQAWISWQGSRAVTYQVQSAGAPSGPWQDEGDPVRPATNGPTLLPLSDPEATSRVFRLRVMAP